MSATIDESGRLLDPEAEVRKLQKMVKKLTEERNQYLLNSTMSMNTNHILQKSDLSENLDSYKKQNIDKLKDGLSEMTLDDVELLDVSCLENLDEEDTWLYKSPRKPTAAQQQISPYKWVREEFDFPTPQLESARRSLLHKLDELTRIPRSPSAGSLSLGSPMSPMNSTPVSQHLSHVASTGCMPSIRQPLLGLSGRPNTGSRIDSTTMTRPKKNVPNRNINHVSNKTNTSPYSSPRDTPERNNNSNYDYGHVDENANGHSCASSGSQESLGTTHKMTDMSDIQDRAMMQQESLRQSISSPYLSSRKTLSSSLNQSTGGLQDCLDNSNNSSLGSNRSSPGHYDSEMMLQVKRSNNSLASLSSHSNSPPGSPYGSQYLDQRTQAISQNENHGHRRSLPNLSRGPGGAHLPSHGSDSRLRERNSPSPSSRRQPPARTHTYRMSPNRQLTTPESNSPLRTLSPNRGESPQRAYSPQRTISPQRIKAQRNVSPGRTLSPSRSGIPAPARTGIPRPGSKLSTPRRSSIPSVRRSLATPRTNDDSWKDGCY